MAAGEIPDLKATYEYVMKMNVEGIQKLREDKEKEIQGVETTRKTIETLGKNARFKGYVNLGPLCRIYATIKHTGEFEVRYEERAKGEYAATLTKEQTLDFLERRKKDFTMDLQLYDGQLDQLAKRMTIEDDLPLADTAEMPDKILSDQGVAIKQGNFFEIIEKVDGDVKPKSKRISRVRTKT